MVQSKHQFYKLGPDNQKRADITIDLKRINGDKMEEWTPEQKEDARIFIESCEKYISVFKKQILRICGKKPDAKNRIG